MKGQAAILAAAVLSIGSAPPALAQSAATDKGHDMSSGAHAPQAQAHKASGTVTKVDRIAGKVTISHGPVPSLKWPAMTMNFIVRDKGLLDKLAASKKVDFEFVQQGRDYVITSAK
jgi:Cu(I)/Ag(I) efflux system periplasmic protein CusF